MFPKLISLKYFWIYETNKRMKIHTMNINLKQYNINLKQYKIFMNIILTEHYT